MDSEARYCVNTPNVLHETIDGETVIINLANGRYYSLEHTGALLWGLVDDGASVGEMVRWIAGCHSASQEEVARAVGQFLGELLQEGLVRADPSSGPHAEGIAALSAPCPESGTLESLVLRKYTDMQDLLLLDPIHEVDEAGWPMVKPDGPSAE